jgi:N-acetylmuramic acid 6-phosphate etherase
LKKSGKIFFICAAEKIVIKEKQPFKYMSITESASNYNHLEQMSVKELLANINREDQRVPLAIEKAIPQIEELVKEIVQRMQQGGRLFYIGAGTSGRLGIVDASECPPTYGVPHDWVIGLIAGGDAAIRKAVEFAEDDEEGAWCDMQPYQPDKLDSVIGIAASGRTPYVIGGLRSARQAGLLTGSITCNPASAVAAEAEYPVEVITGPEFVTGSTRMKAGTAQKLALNMISTAVMVQLGRVRGNKMVDMQLSNHKLVQRGTRMIMDELGIGEKEASELLKAHGSVRKAVDSYRKKNASD